MHEKNQCVFPGTGLRRKVIGVAKFPQVKQDIMSKLKAPSAGECMVESPGKETKYLK